MDGRAYLKVAGTGIEQTRFHSGNHRVVSSFDAKCDAILADRIQLLARAVVLVAGMRIRDFIYVEPSGHRFTKAAGVAAIKTGGERHAVSDASSIDVRVYGGGTVAVDIGDYKEAGKELKPTRL